MGRADLLWGSGVALVATAIFCSTYSTRIASGDAPESAAGIKSLGVVHAPGYPAYVLLARAFTWFVPFGSFTARVNLFSLVCAVVAVGGLYLVARLFCASSIGASLGPVTPRT